MILLVILTLSIIAGQLAKLPFFNYGGITLIDIVVIGADAMLLLRSWKSVKNIPLFAKWAIGFVIIGLLSLAITPLHLQQIELLTSLFYIVRFLSFLMVGLLIVNKVIFQKHHGEKILLYSGIGLALAGFIQLVVFPSLEPLAAEGWDPHVDRIVSTFLDPNFLAAYLVLTLLLIFINPHQILKGKWQKIAFVMVYLAFVGTFSRGGYVMLTVSFVLFSILTRSMKTALITALLIAGLGIGYYVYRIEVAKPRHVDRGQSAELRISSWEQGSQMFLHAPVLGVGFNAYRYGLREYNLASSGQLQSRGATSNDSSLLFVAATTGVAGLIAYLGFLFSLLKMGWQLYRKHDPFGLLILTMMIGLLSQSFFSNLLFYPFILFWIFTLAGLATKNK